MRGFFNQAVTSIKGIGPKKAQKLAKLNIYTVGDVVFNFPRSFEDRGQIRSLNSLKDGEKATISGKIVGMTRKRAKRLTIITVNIVNNMERARLVFFNKDYILNTFKRGDEILAFGKVKRLSPSSTPELSNCEIEYRTDNPKNVGKIIPVYSLTEGIGNKEMMGITRNVWDDIDFEIEDYMPAWIREKFRLRDLDFSLRNVHFPKDKDALRSSVYRIIFEELLILQLGLFIYKNGARNSKGVNIPIDENLDKYEKKLGFKLTRAQKRALNDVLNDMSGDIPMNRLIQGDVGSGKTAVSMLAAVNSALNGYQSALMVPTEILASQHFESFENFLKDTDIKVGLLTGKLKGKDKKAMLEKISSGEIDIVIGTHALIQDGVEFNNLGLVITDEQHRFGVNQRGKLARKSESPNVLIMTATPIPRTLALIIFGDLDVSIIDELPPGRQEVITNAVGPNRRDYVYDTLVVNEIEKGRQVYVVCPLVEESEHIEALNSEDMFVFLRDKYNGRFRLGLIHGKMKQDEKDEVMGMFKNGELDILVSTTVIEVGVNVPNATLMVIENAERFGLAQLHQLRGRVGRGGEQSRCVLIHHKDTDVCRQRMAIMQETNDGFKISEKDLEIRGTGEFFGTKQHGLPELKLANLFQHRDILVKAQEVARGIISEDPKLEMKENERLKEHIIDKFGPTIKAYLILN